MNILYIAKHGSGGSDDEGAIAYALEHLGHHVVRVEEKQADLWPKWIAFDFALVHHWHDTVRLERLPMPKVFWCFDRIDEPDPSLEARNRQRRDWVRRITAACDLGFCTDGDWVAGDVSGKLTWLTQGADERVVGKAKPVSGPLIPLLFTGTRHGGQMRESFVAEMKQRYGADFHHVEKGVYGRELASLISRAAIVLAPDGPVTHRYWSNRVYNVCGFGGFLLHPWCEGLEGQYESYEVCCYRDRKHLHRLVVQFLDPSWEGVCQNFKNRALERTKAEHLYRHRCEKLVATVKARLKL